MQSTTCFQMDPSKTITDFSISAIMGNTFGPKQGGFKLEHCQEAVDLEEQEVHFQESNGDAEVAIDLSCVYKQSPVRQQQLQAYCRSYSSSPTNSSSTNGKLSASSQVITDQNDNTSNSNNSQNKRPRPKRYQCPYCWVALSNTGQFRGHIRIHTGERPFKCDQPNCEKTFTRNEELTRHKRIHTGQRPFACHLCNKRFGRKDHLKKHTRTHERHARMSAISTPSPDSISNPTGDQLELHHLLPHSHYHQAYHHHLSNAALQLMQHHQHQQQHSYSS